jgi:CHAT domain
MAAECAGHQCGRDDAKRPDQSSDLLATIEVDVDIVVGALPSFIAYDISRHSLPSSHPRRRPQAVPTAEAKLLRRAPPVETIGCNAVKSSRRRRFTAKLGREARTRAVSGHRPHTRRTAQRPRPGAVRRVSVSPNDTTHRIADSARYQADDVDGRRHAARNWDDILAQIRTTPGFEHFLAAIPYPELAAAAASGPVVIVNVSRYGGHALIVAAGIDHARVVNLPGLTLNGTADCANRMLEALANTADPQRTFREREKDSRAIQAVLDWLWEVIAEPVLADLGHTCTPEVGNPWPRVWWCATGPLTLMPLHAAGHHPRLRTTASDCTDCVLDRVISSYTPTLTALARARQLEAPALVRQLTVGMPTTPGFPPLPAVNDELRILARHFPPGEANHQLVESQATRTAALTALAAHSWVHLACHATQHQDDPTRSGFAVWNATLTIADLAGQPTQSRDLAFLSACEAAAGSVRQLDEAIHLAAAMQFSATGTSSPPCGLSPTRPPRLSPIPSTPVLPSTANEIPTALPRPSTGPFAPSANSTPPIRCCGRRTFTSGSERRQRRNLRDSRYRRRWPCGVNTRGAIPRRAQVT